MNAYGRVIFLECSHVLCFSVQKKKVNNKIAKSPELLFFIVTGQREQSWNLGRAYRFWANINCFQEFTCKNGCLLTWLSSKLWEQECFCTTCTWKYFLTGSCQKQKDKQCCGRAVGTKFGRAQTCCPADHRWNLLHTCTKKVTVIAKCFALNTSQICSERKMCDGKKWVWCSRILYSKNEGSLPSSKRWQNFVRSLLYSVKISWRMK